MVDLPRIIRLNVGGQHFVTSRDTLQKPGTMLAAMFSGSISSTQDEQGAYFIDRDPKHFGRILNYLRDDACTIPCNRAEQQELFFEARFYQVDGLVQELQLGMVHKPAYPLQQRVAAATLEHPDVCCIRDLVIKVAFEETPLTPNHLISVTVSIACTASFVKLRCSGGRELYERFVDAATDMADFQRLSKACRHCCDYPWALAPSIHGLEQGLAVQEAGGETLSSCHSLVVQLTWEKLPVLPLTLQNDPLVVQGTFTQQRQMVLRDKYSR